MYFSTLLKDAVIAIALGAAVEAAPNVFPVDAVGDVTAVRDETGTGATRIFYQDRNGTINRLCISSAPSQGGSQTCLDTTTRDVVPANEVLFGTPLAAMTVVNSAGQFGGSHVYFVKPDHTLGEFIANHNPTHGPGCVECIDREGYQVVPGSQVLYAIGTTSSKTFRRRVGFVSPGQPNTITEATWNIDTKQWSLAVLPD
ncbi:hypothetical protein K435DRAFT_835424 [Dendrothele bispora CBS 962.96]|uniref:Uncharacterized protein n=1 Tax=Dendrothele bispora (strain CBS 962.96) TaxID=1314807 RepID=A0A4S8MP27_DENBC|nr:hypothetical protein K435DRAFT_835424 [Dendrothele bispora CBS 962.96]